MKKDNEKKTEGNSGKSLMENLPALWDQTQYDEEYDLTTFVSQLSKK